MTGEYFGGALRAVLPEWVTLDLPPWIITLHRERRAINLSVFMGGFILVGVLSRRVKEALMNHLIFLLVLLLIPIHSPFLSRLIIIFTCFLFFSIFRFLYVLSS